jgi:hypothetical protein
MKLPFKITTLEEFIDTKEDYLLELWDTVKYEKYQDLFHYDNVDYWNEELFMELAEEEYEKFLRNNK